MKGQTIKLICYECGWEVDVEEQFEKVGSDAAHAVWRETMYTYYHECVDGLCELEVKEVIPMEETKV